MFTLASGSPRRRELLEAAGYEFRVQVSEFDEESVSNPDPQDLAIALAAGKGQAVSALLPDSLIVSGDTVVFLPSESLFLAKPRDESESKAMLERLSGVSHQVISAVALVRGKDSLIETCAVTTEVHFAELSPELISRYVSSGSPMDKAGGYGIQDLGGALVRRIEGSYTNVLGMPMVETVELLRAQGISPKVAE